MEKSTKLNTKIENFKLQMQISAGPGPGPFNPVTLSRLCCKQPHSKDTDAL